MSDRSRSIKLLLTPLLGLIFLSQSSTAHAWNIGNRNDIGNRNQHSSKTVAWGRGRQVSHPQLYNYHNRYPVGKFEFVLPQGYVEIVFGGGRYYFGGGHFYRREPRGFVTVPPPVGAFIYKIPDGHNRIIINGVTYYSYDGVYYQPISNGYQVIEPPANLVLGSTTVMVNSPAGQPEGAFTVNIPNHQGGYTAVVLKRSRDGFIGPQGEFYPEFPPVDQLRVMYAK
jgi:hypothetical protein